MVTCKKLRDARSFEKMGRRNILFIFLCMQGWETSWLWKIPYYQSLVCFFCIGERKDGQQWPRRKKLQGGENAIGRCIPTQVYINTLAVVGDEFLHRCSTRTEWLLMLAVGH